jgi:uncharacterized protein YecE (DUF72 family)
MPRAFVGISGYDYPRWAGSAWAVDGRDVYVYFDNDARGHAPHDARALAQLVTI